MQKRLNVKYSLFVSDFNGSGIFSTDFQKKIQIKNFIKIRPVGAELFHADRYKDGRRTEGRTDRQTDMTMLMVARRNFTKAPKMVNDVKF
jgi:hypoxanthine-guanine phosphoribosyltransferase